MKKQQYKVVGVCVNVNSADAANNAYMEEKEAEDARYTREEIMQAFGVGMMNVGKAPSSTQVSSVKPEVSKIVNDYFLLKL